jgi:hypothetical protein
MGGEKRRPRIIRITLAALWIGLGVLLFVFNRGHTLLVDNRNVEDSGIRAPDLIKVSVDGKPALEFLRGDRDRVTVAGIRHRIRIEFTDGRPPFEGAFALPIKDDMYILSAPKMIAGIEPFVEVFRTAPETRVPEEEPPGEEDPDPLP